MQRDANEYDICNHLSVKAAINQAKNLTDAFFENDTCELDSFGPQFIALALVCAKRGKHFSSTASILEAMAAQVIHDFKHEFEFYVTDEQMKTLFGEPPSVREALQMGDVKLTDEEGDKAVRLLDELEALVSKARS